MRAPTAGEIGVPGHRTEGSQATLRPETKRRGPTVRAMTSQRRTLTLVVMCVGMFLVLLDVTIVNVALPRLRAELGRRRAQPAMDRRRLRGRRWPR